MPYYVGLFTSRVGDEGVEPTDPAYSRQEVKFSPFGPAVTNLAALNFGAVTREHTLLELGIFDHKQGGHLLYFGPLDHPTHVLPGDQISFAVGALRVTTTSLTSVPAVPAEALAPIQRPTAWARILKDD